MLLLWGTSPFRVSSGWKMSISFISDTGRLENIVRPWGDIRSLRFGSYYIDGERTNNVLGEAINIDISDMQGGVFCSSGTVPRNAYRLFTHENLMEKCLKYESEDKIIIIPCIEVVRSLLLVTRFLSDAILYPQGLENLVDDRCIIDKDTLYMKLNDRIPSHLVNDLMIKHLAWLLYNESAREAWDVVYRNIFMEENKTTDNKIQIPFPYVGPCSLCARAIIYNNFIIVLEIVNVTNLQVPFKNIKYSHKSLVARTGITEYKIKDINGGKTIDIYELDDSNESVSNFNEPAIIETSPYIISFNNEVDVTADKKEVKRGDTGFVIKKEQGQKEEISITESAEVVSTSEPSVGGSIRQLEFTNTEETEYVEGLDKFINTITILKEIMPDYKFKYTVKDLPKDGFFSELQNGNSRKYILLAVTDGQSKPIFIIEVALPDNRYLSTLLFWPKQDIRSEELKDFVNKLVTSLVVNNGSWNTDFLNNSNFVKFSKLRHLKKQSSLDWAMKIKEKIEFMFD